MERDSESINGGRRRPFAWAAWATASLAGCSPDATPAPCEDCGPADSPAAPLAETDAANAVSAAVPATTEPPLGWLASLTDTSDFPPRWNCGTWTDLHGWVHIAADTGIVLAYLAIPALIAFFLRKRRDLPFKGVLAMFVAFIVLCGMTHMLEALMFWWPAYRLMGLVKVLTAIVSVLTAIKLVSVVPVALQLRSPAELERQVKKRTEALEVAREEAQHAANERERFAANMSHEIRTPLTAIIGHSELLTEDPSLSDDQRAQLVTVRENSKHLLAVVNDVLDLSKSRADKVELGLVSTDVRELLTASVDLLDQRARSKQVTLTHTVDPSVPARFVIDPMRVRQVLLNLIGNAVKFTDAGGRIDVTLRAEAHASGWRLVCEVVDTGIGMTLDQADRVFDEFAQADSSSTRRFGGTGLGLTISQRLARIMGGDLIVAATAPGKGTTMRFELAAQEESEAESTARESTAAHATRGASTQLEGMRILLAEDTHDSRVLFERILRSRGATVESVMNGRDAVRAARNAHVAEHPYDVILMDVQMPVMDGLTAVRELRGSGHEEPIIALTAHASDADRDRTRAAGCDGHLTKPVRVTELVDAMDALRRTRPVG